MEKAEENVVAERPGTLLEKWDGASYSFGYEVRRCGDEVQASIPYRQIVWIGKSREEAIGELLRGVAELARAGSLDPKQPQRRGATPLQHVMSILEEQLAWHLERRREQIEHLNRKERERPDANDVELPVDQRLNRLNEIISGLSTGIAALARVKEL